MIHAVIELGDQRIHEVMVPRIAMVTLPATASMDEAIDTVIEGGHSRIPVYEETIDEIMGILYAKDLLPFLKGSVTERPSLRSLLRTPVFVPESMSVDDLLHEFQRRKVHIAIVLDEYGGTAGLVTIEDLLEEIVGEIQDEYDEEEPLIVRLSDDEARIEAGPTSTTWPNCSTRTSGSRTPTSTTPSAGSSITVSAACRSPETRSWSMA